MFDYFSQNSLLWLVIICLLTAILILYKKDSKTKSQNGMSETPAQNEKSLNWKKRKNIEEALNKKIRCNPSDYYNKKKNLMTDVETDMFFFINNAINDIKKEMSQYFFLFPQVNLYAFINQRENKKNTKETKNRLLHILGGKHVDFILCHKHKDINGKKFIYEPILMIEIDDSSHFSSYRYGKESYNRTKENDSLKNKLATELKLHLLRYRLTDGKISETDKYSIHTAFEKFFSEYKNKETEFLYYYDKNGFMSESAYYNC